MSSSADPTAAHAASRLPARVAARSAARALIPGRAMIAAAIALLATASLVPHVSAVDIPRLDSSITDRTGVLASNRDRILGALDQLQTDTGVDMHVLFVPTTDGQDIVAYGKAVADQNGLSGRYALLVVALNDRTDVLRVGDPVSEVTTAELERIRTQGVEARLAARDYGGAVVAAADGLRTAAGVVVPQPTAATPATAAPRPTEGGAGTVSGSGSGGGGTLVIVALLAIVGIGAWLYSRVKKGRAVVQQRRTDEQLGRDANSLLIETDDLIRDARQEVGFAEAQFGSEAVKPFDQALAGAAAELKAAFGLGQQLDDAEPEPTARRAEMLKEIVERCGRAKSTVEQQRAAIAGLRDLEKSAPQVLAALPDQLDSLEARIPVADGTLARLHVYADSTWQSVANNIPSARDRLTEARKQLAAGQAAAAATPPRMSEAALDARNAQLAAAQASASLDAIDKLAGSLAEMQKQLGAELAAAGADVRAAQAAVAAGQVTGMEARLAEAQASLTAAEQEARQQKPDIVAALRQASNANQTADAVLAGVREAQAQRQRTAAMASSAVSTADANVTRVRDYIEGQRATYPVGRMARNRIVEAERRTELARSLLSTDPSRATLEAQNADHLADAAYQLALDDMSGGYGTTTDAYRSGGPVVTYQSGGGGEILTAVLGGLLGGMLTGGGGSRRHSGWGGGFGGGSGGSSWGGGSGGWSTGGWGGGGGQSSGGSFGGGGGGGGRSSGGGW